MMGRRLWRQLSALVALDLRLHGWAMLGVTAAGVAFIVLAHAVRPNPGGAGLIALAFNMNFLFSMVWSDWLISREKIVRTIGWIRSLPVSDAVWVSAKVLTISLAITVTWLVSARVVASATGVPLSSSWWLMLAGLLTQGVLSVCARVRFTQKTGQILPLVVVGVPLAVLVLARRSAPESAQLVTNVWHAAWGREAAVGLAATASLVTLLAAIAWLKRTDTHALFE
jgi:hypothetical protein